MGEKAKAAAKKAKEAALQKGRKQAQRWDLGNMFGQEKATRAPRRSKVQIMLAKRAKEAEKKAKEEAKKAKEQQKARQTALKNAAKAMKEAQKAAKAKAKAQKENKKTAKNLKKEIKA